MDEVIVVMNAIGEHENKASRKGKRKELAQKHGGVGR